MFAIVINIDVPCIVIMRLALIADKTVCMSDAMRERTKRSPVYINSYPVFFIATENLNPSETVTLRVAVVEPDLAFSGFDGYVSLSIVAHVAL